MLEIKDGNAGFAASFKSKLAHSLLCGGSQHGIATQDSAFPDAASGIELKLETNYSNDFHATGKIGINNFDGFASTLTDWPVGEDRSRAQEKGCRKG